MERGAKINRDKQESKFVKNLYSFQTEWVGSNIRCLFKFAVLCEKWEKIMIILTRTDQLEGL